MLLTTASLLTMNQGKVIGIFHEYGQLGKCSSIHSPLQMELYKVSVDDKSIKVGGTQCIQTLEGYAVLLSIQDSLAYMRCLGAPSDHDMASYLHVLFTSPEE